MSESNDNEKDKAYEVVENYRGMIMKYWQKCPDAITFDEMVNEVYIRAKENNVTMDRGKKQVTTYMSKICYTLSTAALKFNSNTGKSLGLSLGRSRAKSIESFDQRLEGLKNPTKAKNFSKVDSVWGSFTVQRCEIHGQAVTGSTPVFGGGSSHSIEQEISLRIDIEENLSEKEQIVANMLMKGDSVTAVANAVGIHPWTLRKTVLPRIADRLDLKESN